MATRIVVEGISSETTESDIETLFSNYGEVDEVVIHGSKNGKRTKKYGMVQMPNSEEAQKAITVLHGKDLDGRKLNINQASPLRRT